MDTKFNNMTIEENTRNRRETILHSNSESNYHSDTPSSRLPPSQHINWDQLINWIKDWIRDDKKTGILLFRKLSGLSEKNIRVQLPRPDDHILSRDTCRSLQPEAG